MFSLNKHPKFDLLEERNRFSSFQNLGNAEITIDDGYTEFINKKQKIS